MSGQTRTRAIRILISGAADGVGFACACAFAARGAELFLCDTNGTDLTRVSDMLGAYSAYCDVISDNSIAIFVAEVTECFGSFDVLINAAGNGYVRSLGMVQLTRALLPLLRKGSGPRLIVNIAPEGGWKPAQGMFPYAGSREGFQRLADAIAQQTKGTSIGVVNVIPKMKNSGREPTHKPGPLLYEVQRIDEEEAAERIVDLVAATRPEWRQQPPIPRDRRA